MESETGDDALDRALNVSLLRNAEATDAERIAQEKIDIVSALIDDYLNIYAVYLDKDIVDVIKLNGYVVDGLQEGARSIPYTALVARYVENRVHPEDRSMFSEHLSKDYLSSLSNSRKLAEFTYRVQIEDGIHYFSVRCTRVSKDGEPMRFIMGFRNVDEVVEAEKRYRDVSEESMALAAVQESINSGYWHMAFDRDGKMTNCIWTKSFRALLGVKDTDDFPDKLESWTSRLHPDHKEKVMSAFWKAINDKTGKSTYDVEYLLLTLDRGYRWFHAAGSLVRREDGSPVSMHGVFIDKDDLHKKDEALQTALDKAKNAAEAAQEQLDIIRALSSDYLNIYALNSLNDKVDVVQLRGYVVEGLSEGARGLPYTMFIKRYINTMVHPEDRQTLATVSSLDNLNRVMASNDRFDLTYRTLSHGEVHYFSVRYTRVSKAGEDMRIIIGFRNVDEVVAAEKKYRSVTEESRALAAVQASMGSGYWHMTFDRDCTMTSCTWTAAFRALLGFTDEKDFPNKCESWTDLIHPDYKPQIMERFWGAIKDFSGETIYDEEYPCAMKNGEYHWFHDAGRLVRREDGSPVAIHGIFIDVDATHKKDAALRDALAAAEKANKAKTVFLNNMSHDIRTPMNAIIGFTTLAATHISHPDQVRDYLSKIQTSSNHLLSLINDVLDMSRIEAGRVTIDVRETSLPEVLHDLRTIVQDDIKNKRLEFFIDTVDVIDETVVCDKLRLNQVLLNLISNAMKFTPPGGMVGVRVTEKSKAEEGVKRFATYTFEVRDNGIGIGEKFLPHMFEPFSREKSTTVSGIPGTGLGLSITKNIVNMMGGSIEVKSERGKGTVFTVTLRFATSGEEVNEGPVKALEGLRSLVVDDDFGTCASITKMLTNIGMRPDWTTSGKEAVLRAGLAVEQGDAYAAYIIDWLMPDMNGVEVVRRIRSQVGVGTPIIILTAYDWSDIEDEAREAGVTAFCSKPIFMSELRAALLRPSLPKKKVQHKVISDTRFKGKRLLVVEDNALNREISTGILEEAGFLVESAEDGEKALDMVANAAYGYYDVVLMDVQMPVMDGYEATKLIRTLEDKAKANIPIVAMTANAFEEDKQAAIDAGMNGYISKPIDIESMFSLLGDVLKGGA